jgi:hypothetical protein
LTLSLFAAGCQVTEQELPFELAPGESVDVQIGSSGGTISLPPSFSLDFPQGALGTNVAVQVQPLLDRPFPSTAGIAVPGTAYDLQPMGTVLSNPARVEIKIPDTAVGEGEEVRVSVGVQRPDGSVATFSGTYDLTNGVIVAEITELGPIAAVITADAIAVTAGLPDDLPGGMLPPPPSPVSPAGGPAPSSHGGVEFTADCAPEARNCYSSGLIRVWADDIVRERIGDDLFLVSPSVSASLDFISYDSNGIPTQIVGSVSVDGDLRARFNSSVNSYTLDEGLATGTSGEPAPTGLTIAGNIMVIDATTNTSTGSVDFNEDLEFGIAEIGTSDMLTIRVEAEVEFENSDGTEEIGLVVALVRLRR